MATDNKMITSTITFKQLENRIDAEYYKPEYLKVANVLKSTNQSLRNLSQVITKGETPLWRGDVYVEKGIPFLRVLNFIENNLDLSNIVYISDSVHNRMKRSQLKPGDILYSMAGRIGTAVIIPDNLKIANINQAIAKIRLKAGTINSYYLITFLNTRFGFLQALRKVSGGVQNNINFEDIKSIKVFIPSLSFQLKIEKIMKVANEKRKLAEQKYQEAQELLNKYLGIDEQKFEFPKTFSLKFSELEDRFDGEYYEPKALSTSPVFKNGTFKLGELVKINMGKTPAKQEYTKSGVRILKVRDLTNKGIDWSERERAFIKKETWEKSIKSRIQEGDILLISAAHQAYYIGKEFDIVLDIPKNYDNKLLGVAELLIIRSNGKINPYVLLWYLRTPIIYRFIQQLITGETSHLYPKDLTNLPIPKILIDCVLADKIEKLTKESIILQKQSKELLEEAKRKVEEMIEKGGEKNGKRKNK